MTVSEAMAAGTIARCLTMPEQEGKEQHKHTLESGHKRQAKAEIITLYITYCKKSYIPSQHRARRASSSFLNGSLRRQAQKQSLALPPKPTSLQLNHCPLFPSLAICDTRIDSRDVRYSTGKVTACWETQIPSKTNAALLHPSHSTIRRLSK